MGQEGEVRHKLSEVQAAKESVLPGATTRVWTTARYPEEIGRALEKPVPQRILVIGCGVDEAACYADLLPNAQIIGVDFNQDVTEAAQSQYPRVNVSYRHGDILDSDVIRQLENESFGAIVLTGVLTNLVHNEDITRLFGVIENLLAPQGRVIISDYLLNQSEDEWGHRYMRDLAALLEAELFDDSDPIPPYGVWVSRPFGKSAVDAYFLSVEKVTNALRTGEYERLVRHWHPILLMKLITNAVQGHMRMKLAKLDYKEFDPHVTLGDLGWLTTIGMILEKKAFQSDDDLAIEEAILFSVSSAANQGGFPSRYDAAKFFDGLVDESF